jgi:hypothetical protein
MANPASSISARVDHLVMCILVIVITSEERIVVNRRLLLKFVGSVFLTQIHHVPRGGMTSSDATPESHIFIEIGVQLNGLGMQGRFS